MNGNEHRDIGDAACGGALVNLGGESAQERFWLGYGDVMALSGDYFLPGSLPGSDDEHLNADTLASGTLFGLARVPGRQGAKPATRDEIVCALRVMTIDEGFADPRFEAGGRFADWTFDRRGAPGEVERRVRDRYLELAATNDDHFVVPGGLTSPIQRARAAPSHGAPPSSPTAIFTRTRWSTRAGWAAAAATCRRRWPARPRPSTS